MKPKRMIKTPNYYKSAFKKHDFTKSVDNMTVEDLCDDTKYIGVLWKGIDIIEKEIENLERKQVVRMTATCVAKLNSLIKRADKLGPDGEDIMHRCQNALEELAS